jgi:hypothetical protein
MNETKIKTGTFQYANLLQTGETDSITMTVNGVKYGVPLDESNTDYAIIKQPSSSLRRT